MGHDAVDVRNEGESVHLQKSINLREKDLLSDFRPVPADLNPTQAADLLNSGFAEVALGPVTQDSSGRSIER
jgi:hypothetical protein